MSEQYYSSRGNCKSTYTVDESPFLTSEQYYVEMETARNKAEKDYFMARPQHDDELNRRFFRAGFERAFSLMWGKRDRQDPAS